MEEIKVINRKALINMMNNQYLCDYESKCNDICSDYSNHGDSGDHSNGGHSEYHSEAG